MLPANMFGVVYWSGPLLIRSLLEAQQRQSLFPGLLALLAVGDRDLGVAIVVALDFPFEPKRDEGRRFRDELSGHGLVGPGQRGREQQHEDEGERGPVNHRVRNSYVVSGFRVRHGREAAKAAAVASVRRAF